MLWFNTQFGSFFFLVLTNTVMAQRGQVITQRHIFAFIKKVETEFQYGKDIKKKPRTTQLQLV